jgi:hypothetical protein
VHDGFIAAVAGLGGPLDPSALRPCLLRVAWNEAVRRSTRRAGIRQTDDRVFAERPSQGPSAEDAAHRRELAELIRAATDGLTENGGLYWISTCTRAFPARRSQPWWGVTAANARKLAQRAGRPCVGRAGGRLLRRAGLRGGCARTGAVSRRFGRAVRAPGLGVWTPAGLLTAPCVSADIDEGLGGPADPVPSRYVAERTPRVLLRIRRVERFRVDLDLVSLPVSFDRVRRCTFPLVALHAASVKQAAEPLRTPVPRPRKRVEFSCPISEWTIWFCRVPLCPLSSASPAEHECCRVSWFAGLRSRFGLGTARIGHSPGGPWPVRVGR